MQVLLCGRHGTGLTLGNQALVVDGHILDDGEVLTEGALEFPRCSSNASAWSF